MGHDDCKLSVEERDDFLKMHQEVEELISAETDRLAEDIKDLKDDVEEMTELGVQESDAEEYTNNMFAKKLTTIARLKKCVVKKGASVLTDELGFEEMDADDILEALMIEENHNGDDSHTANDTGKVVAIDPKLVRSDDDIKPAV